MQQKNLGENPEVFLICLVKYYSENTSKGISTEISL